MSVILFFSNEMIHSKLKTELNESIYTFMHIKLSEAVTSGRIVGSDIVASIAARSRRVGP